jgi:hypothetical protein
MVMWNLLSWADEELANFELILPEKAGSFGLGLADSWCDSIDSCSLLPRHSQGMINKRNFEEVLVHVVEMSSRYVKGDNDRSELGLALQFLVGGIKSMKVSIP